MRVLVLRDVEQLWSELKDRPHMAAMVLGVGRLLWTYADDLDEDIVAKNPFKKAKLDRLPPRTQVWEPEQIVAVLRTALTPGSWGRPWGGLGGGRGPGGSRALGPGRLSSWRSCSALTPPSARATSWP